MITTEDIGFLLGYAMCIYAIAQQLGDVVYLVAGFVLIYYSLRGSGKLMHVK